MNGKAPDAFRTISEVADWLGVNTHVLRFWESKFSQVKPVKRAGGRRYYRPSDMELLGGIQKLLHEDGMTIKGVQKILREQGIRAVCAMSRPLDAEMGAEPATETPDADHEAPVHEPVVEISADTEPEPDVESALEYLHLAGASVSMDAAQSNGSAHGAGTTETPRPAREEIAPVAEPAEDPARETDAVQLFAHRETPPGETPESADTTPVEVAAGPVIAPLPGADLTVAEALERLVPLQVRPELLRPIHAKLVALRGRMDSAG